MKEYRTTEFKESISDSFLKTVCAFANYGEGVIYFGIDDNGEPVGIANPDKACLDIENKINDSITPHPDYNFDIDYDKRLVKLTIREGLDKPYTVRGKAYKRNGTSTIETDRHELIRLILEGKKMNYEQLKATRQDLTFQHLTSRLTKVMGIGKASSDILKTLQLLSSDNVYNIAAELLADNNDFPGIDIVLFGNSQNEIRDRETTQKTSVLAQYDAAVRFFEKNYQYDIIEGLNRRTVSLIPKEAFREAIANALTHRDWSISANIQIACHPDMVTITSPGELPPGMTEEAYLSGGLSVLRNPILAMVFYRLKMIEMFGTGITRIKQAYQNLGCSPSFAVSNSYVKIILPTIPNESQTSPDERSVLETLSATTDMSSSQIATATGFSKDKTIRLINALLAQNRLTAFGKGRARRYRLN